MWFWFLLKIDLSLLVGKAAITLHFFTPSKSNSNILLLLGHEHNLPRLERRPLVPLNVIRDDGQEAKDANHLDQQLLAIVVLRLGSPLQESGHVLGQLALRRRCAVLVLDDLERG